MARSDRFMDHDVGASNVLDRRANMNAFGMAIGKSMPREDEDVHMESRAQSGKSTCGELARADGQNLYP